MKTYFSNGIIQEIDYLLEDNFQMFYIQDLGDEYTDRYVYPYDSIKYRLDNELVLLYDKFRDLIFPDTETYYQELNSLPIWVQHAGQNSDCSITSNQFSELIQECSENIPNLLRHLYLVDCQFLVGTIQNLLSGMEYAFVNYFINISHASKRSEPIDDDTILCEISWNSRCISGLLENYFIKAYSILDILCKICHEFQNPQTDFSSYKKMNSSEMLWGSRKKLRINGSKETLFEDNTLIRSIEALRNEAIHNGTWELNPKIYYRFENGSVAEHYMLFPDIDQGHLSTTKNRRHFFGEETKVNDVLPVIHLTYQNLLMNTIAMLNEADINSSM